VTAIPAGVWQTAFIITPMTDSRALLVLAKQFRDAATEAGRPDAVAEIDEAIILLAVTDQPNGKVDSSEDKTNVRCALLPQVACCRARQALAGRLSGSGTIRQCRASGNRDSTSAMRSVMRTLVIRPELTPALLADGGHIGCTCRLRGGARATPPGCSPLA
jgi:hypothetical protein